MKKYSVLLKIPVRERKIIGGFVLLAIFAVLSIFIFPAQFQNLASVRKQLRSQTSLIKSREKKTANLLLIKEKHSSLMAEVKNAHNMFFNSEETVNFLKSINELAERQTNNNLLMMQPLSEETIEPSFLEKDKGFIYKKKVIRLAVEGSFMSIEDLIKRFDNYEKLLRIESIRLEHEDQTSIIKAQFELAMYLLTEDKVGTHPKTAINHRGH